MRPPKAMVSHLGRSVFRALHECFGGGYRIICSIPWVFKRFHTEVWVDSTYPLWSPYVSTSP